MIKELAVNGDDLILGFLPGYLGDIFRAFDRVINSLLRVTLLHRQTNPSGRGVFHADLIILSAAVSSASWLWWWRQSGQNCAALFPDPALPDHGPFLRQLLQLWAARAASPLAAATFCSSCACWIDLSRYFFDRIEYCLPRHYLSISIFLKFCVCLGFDAVLLIKK